MGNNKARQVPRADISTIQWVGDLTLEVKFKPSTFLDSGVVGNALLEACDNYERVKADRDELARALQDLMDVLDDRPLDIVAQSETWDRARDAVTKSRGLLTNKSR
jgi:hypothetical protein